MPTRRHKPLREEHTDPAACTPSRRLEVLRRLPFLNRLEASRIEEVNEAFTAVCLDRGETIYFTGDRAANLYVVATGKVRLVRHTESGRDVLLSLLAPGDFFGGLEVLGDHHHAETAIAQTHACLLTMDARRFHGMLRRFPEVGLGIIEMMADRLRAAHEVIGQLSSSAVEERIAAALLRLADRLGSPSSEGTLIQVPLSREDLAGLTGTTPETASRVLSAFRKKGWVRSGREWVSVTDREALAGLVR